MAHYWNPTPTQGAERGGIRHAFRGTRWDGEPTAITVCDVRVQMAQASREQWIMYPTCPNCWRILVAENYDRRTA